jgi:hypothetical protein
MGFSQATTTHHFYLTETGGIVGFRLNRQQARCPEKAHLHPIYRAIANPACGTPSRIGCKFAGGMTPLTNLSVFFGADHHA